MSTAFLLRTYKLTQAELDSIVRESEGRCALCFDPHPGRHIDHDHLTGLVRGMLCPGCNHSLGWYDRNQPAIEDYKIRALEWAERMVFHRDVAYLSRLRK